MRRPFFFILQFQLNLIKIMLMLMYSQTRLLREGKSLKSEQTTSFPFSHFLRNLLAQVETFS